MGPLEQLGSQQISIIKGLAQSKERNSTLSERRAAGLTTHSPFFKDEMPEAYAEAKVILDRALALGKKAGDRLARLAFYIQEEKAKGCIRPRDGVLNAMLAEPTVSRMIDDKIRAFLFWTGLQEIFANRSVDEVAAVSRSTDMLKGVDIDDKSAWDEAIQGWCLVLACISGNFVSESFRVDENIMKSIADVQSEEDALNVVEDIVEHDKESIANFTPFLVLWRRFGYSKMSPSELKEQILDNLFSDQLGPTQGYMYYIYHLLLVLIDKNLEYHLFGQNLCEFCQKVADDMNIKV